MNEFKKGAAFVAALVLAGCGTFRAYRLSAGPDQAASMRPALISTAQALGLAANEIGTDVNVVVDEASTVAYRVQGDEYNMVVNVDDKKVKPEELEPRLKATRAKGDEIWSKALRARPTAAPPAPAPPAEGPSRF